MLQDLQLAAPADEGPLVGLLSRWAARGRQESPEPQVQLYPAPAAPCHLSILTLDRPLLAKYALPAESTQQSLDVSRQLAPGVQVPLGVRKTRSWQEPVISLGVCTGAG